jgi:hypothetical protein
MLLIWGRRKAEYFCARDWTPQIALNRFRKFRFARTRFSRGSVRLREAIEMEMD